MLAVEPNIHELLVHVRNTISRMKGTFSRHYEVSRYLRNIPGLHSPYGYGGFQYEEDWIFTPRSYFPSMIVGNFSTNFFGAVSSSFEYGLDFDSIDSVLSNLFGTKAAITIGRKFVEWHNALAEMLHGRQQVATDKLLSDRLGKSDERLRLVEQLKKLDGKSIARLVLNALRHGQKEALVAQAESMLPARVPVRGAHCYKLYTS